MAKSSADSVTEKHSEESLLRLLRKRYPGPAWFFLDHVRNGSGFLHLPRTMDALAVSLWPSRGLDIIGFEIKVARVDWLHELKHPDKQHAFHQYVDKWYVVAPREIIWTGELPSTWGHIYPHGRGLKVAKEPKDWRRSSRDLDLPSGFFRPFLAAIIQRFEHRYINKVDLDDVLKKARAQGVEDGRLSVQNAARDYEKLREVVQEFEAKSGIKLNSYTWNAGPLGAGVKRLLDDGTDTFRLQAERHKQWLQGQLKTTERYLDNLPDAEDEGAASSD